MASLIGAHFTKNGIKQFPARAVLSLNGVGLGGDETHPDTITIVRDTRVFPDGEAPPDFNTFQPTTAVTWAEYGAYWYKNRTMEGGNFRDAWNQNLADYYQICNEQGGNDAWALQRLVDVDRAIMQTANADGKKCCVLNLAGGSPGDFEIWKEICAPFIMWAWENGGNIYGRHVYGDDFVDSNGNVLPGQPQRVIDELEYLKSIGYGGGVVLTECGLDGGYGVADLDRFMWQCSAWEAVLRPFSDMLIGFCWWECGKSEFDADYTDRLKQMVPYMENSYLGKWEPPTVTPPIDPPTPQPVNLLVNPSFEAGWWHLDGRPEFQIPNDWLFSFIEGDFNPFDDTPFVAPEIRVLPKDQLPPHEQDLFVLDGSQTLKAFKGNGAWNATLFQAVTLEPGKHGMTANIFADLVKEYTDDGDKIWADDPGGNDGLVRFSANGVVVNDWYSLWPGQWNELYWEFEASGGTVVTVEFMCPFPLANSGIFADDWKLERIEGNKMKFKDVMRFDLTKPTPEGGRVVIAAWDENEQLAWSSVPIPQGVKELRFKVQEGESENPNPPSVVTLPKGALGVDVSAHQKSFTWDTAVSNGCQYAIIRSSNGLGSSTTDSNGRDLELKRNAEELTRLGLPWAIYHYLRPDHDIDAQVALVKGILAELDILQTYPIKAWFETERLLPTLFVDVEETDINIDMVKQFCEGMATVTSCGIYTRKNIWDSITTGVSNWWGDLILWTAAYGIPNDGTMPPWSDGPFVPNGWDYSTIWQYTSEGQDVLGWSGDGLDLNSAGPYPEDSTDKPPAETYDTSFMRGEPGIWRVIRRSDGSGEDVWELPLDGSNDVRVKNTNEGEWYEYRSDGVYRHRDTSPAPDSQGNERLYLLTINESPGGKIAPAEAEIGKLYSYTNEVQFKAKNGCADLSENSGLGVSTFKLVAIVEDYTFQSTDFTVDKLYITEQTGEIQLYAEHDGRVLGWVGGGANQDNNVWGGELSEVYFDRVIPGDEPKRYC